MPAQDVLDAVHSLTRFDALAADPGGYAERVAEEVGPATTLAELEARDARLVHALAQIDGMVTRAMKIKLDHALAHDSSIGPPTRLVFSQTVVNYARDLGLLEQRAHDVAARGRAADPGSVAAAVVDAARSVLDLREALRDGVLGLVQQLATASIPDADRNARDRRLEEKPRKTWSAARRDLEVIADQPAAIQAAPWAQRIAAHPEQIDEPDPEKEVTFADMIEMD